MHLLGTTHPPVLELSMVRVTLVGVVLRWCGFILDRGFIGHIGQICHFMESPGNTITSSPHNKGVHRENYTQRASQYILDISVVVQSLVPTPLAKLWWLSFCLVSCPSSWCFIGAKRNQRAILSAPIWSTTFAEAYLLLARIPGNWFALLLCTSSRCK